MGISAPAGDNVLHHMTEEPQRLQELVQIGLPDPQAYDCADKHQDYPNALNNKQSGEELCRLKHSCCPPGRYKTTSQTFSG